MLKTNIIYIIYIGNFKKQKVSMSPSIGSTKASGGALAVHHQTVKRSREDAIQARVDDLFNNAQKALLELVDRTLTREGKKDLLSLDRNIELLKQEEPEESSELKRYRQERLNRMIRAQAYLHPKAIGHRQEGVSTYPRSTKTFMRQALKGKDLELGEELGKGNQGQVRLISLNGKSYVQKSWHSSLEAQAAKSLEQTANLIVATSEESPIVLVEAMTEDTLIMEYLPDGDLLQAFSEEGKWLSEEEFLVAVQDMVKALRYVESRGFYHGDVKLENFMRVMKRGKLIGVKLIDLGCSQPQEVPAFAGTLNYKAPELLTRPATGHNSSQSDVFSLGIIIHYYLMGAFPLDLLEEDKIPARFKDAQGDIKEEKYEECVRDFYTKNQGALFQEVIKTSLQSQDEEAAQQLKELDSTGRLRKLAIDCLQFKPEDRPTLRMIEVELEEWAKELN
ncbi:MAG: hypothetical protein FJZ63_02955 [Chlamydiae bacterium]|nr:hypothetical protein [Chlamydiota bacterium]